MAIHIEILLRKATLSVRLFLLFSFFSFDAHAQINPQNDHETAFGQYLNLQFDSCKNQLKKLQKDPYSIYLESLIESTEIFLSDDSDLYKRQKKQEEILLEKVDSFNFPAQQTSFLYSEIKIQWAILKMKYGDEIAAFWSLNKAYHLTKKNIEEYPEFLESQKTMGLLQVLFGVVPENYNWILSIFGIEGDVQQGLDHLQSISATPNLYSLEGDILISLLNTYLLNEPEKGFQTIHEIRNKNIGLLIDYAYGLIAIKNANSESALEVLQTSIKKYSKPIKLPQIYYLLGEVHLQKGELSEAINYYQSFIKNQPGKSLIKDAYYKIGICHLINESPSLAGDNFRMAQSNGWAKNEADSYAEVQIETKDFSTKELYQLRYATDGGFYENALKIQQSIIPADLSGRNRCEYFYRSARLFQKTNKLNAAIKFYLKTLESQSDESWYYAPNAALQLGLIFKSGNDLSQANKYLEMVFKYKNHPYQKSIRQKAKTAIKSLD